MKEIFKAACIILICLMYLFCVIIPERPHGEEAEAYIDYDGTAAIEKGSAEFASNALLAFSAGLSAAFVLVLFYSRPKTSPDMDALSGTCREFEIKKAEMEPQRKK
ncbi:MAG: hypothetical protein IJ600_10320 [Lachnospiraceae bacterium]|nr:hypothetical protein [Lachnospiraceae bacterium]